MRKVNFIIIAIVAFMFISCGGTTTSYVNTEFWEVDHEFEAPEDWETYTYADAFSIQIPTYMKEQVYDSAIDVQKLKNGVEPYMCVKENTLNDNSLNAGEFAEMTFSARNDSLHNNYARIYIKYMKAYAGDFLDSGKLADLNREDSKEFCDLLIKNQLGNGTLIKILKREMIYTKKGNMALDICYQRVGNTENEGPVTVHIYYLQHTDEAVLMTASYHDKNKVKFRDLFNIVETLDWTHYKSRYTTLDD